MTQPSFRPSSSTPIRSARRCDSRPRQTGEPTVWRTCTWPSSPMDRHSASRDRTRATRSSSADDLFVDRLELVAGERAEDAVYGCAMVASARASLFGRAPVGPDLEMAFTLFGFLGGAPKDLIEWRVPSLQRSGPPLRRAAPTGRGGPGGDAQDDGATRSASVSRSGKSSSSPQLTGARQIGDTADR